jgi:hypothetical protein
MTRFYFTMLLKPPQSQPSHPILPETLDAFTSRQETPRREHGKFILVFFHCFTDCF